jgi:xanthosine utilization system XapX-like protein
MVFNSREWVNEIVMSTFTSAVGGAVAALVPPDAPLAPAIAAAGLSGLIVGLVNLPVKWLLERRPRPAEKGPAKDAPRALRSETQEKRRAAEGDDNEQYE